MSVVYLLATSKPGEHQRVVEILEGPVSAAETYNHVTGTKIPRGRKINVKVPNCSDAN